MEITASLASVHLKAMPAVHATTAAPDAAATQQFAALMQAPARETAAPPATAVRLEPAASGSFGDRILHGMQNVSNEFRDTWTRVSDTLRPDGPEISMQQMLSLQLHLTQASVQYDLLGKAVSRSTQNFDQLVRVQ